MAGIAHLGGKLKRKPHWTEVISPRIVQVKKEDNQAKQHYMIKYCFRYVCYQIEMQLYDALADGAWAM